MKVYGYFFKHYTIEVEVSDDATTQDIYDAVNEKFDTLYENDMLDADDVYLDSIVDENDDFVWEN